MGAHQRRKGANAERELCALLAEEFGIKVQRNLGQARDGGSDIPIPGFLIESKRPARVAVLYPAMEQAIAGLRPIKHPQARQTPCVALRADGKEWLVVMRFKDWCRLAREEVASASVPVVEE